MTDDWTPDMFGRRVLGPVVAEFCLRLWSLGSLLNRPADASFLFCARGGLRMLLAYERFLRATGLPAPIPAAPLMVSRVAAVRPALMRTLDVGLDDLVPSAADTLAYEFSRASLSGVAFAVAGVRPATTDERWDLPFSSRGFVALLRHPDGDQIVASLAEQAVLFTRHLRETLGRRGHAVIVDTGLYGTTRQLLADGLPTVEISSALIARSFRPGSRHVRTFGLSAHSEGYSPLQRRTAMLRYWHLVESLFEPDLPSVRTYSEDRGTVRSNLEVDGWQRRVDPVPGTVFQGVVDYLDALPPGSGERVLADADRAWSEYRRAVVWPHHGHALALQVGARSHDFGSDRTWLARTSVGAVGALRGSSMWREGEIARTGSRLRVPLLAALEAAYGVRRLKRTLSGRTRQL